MRTPRDTHLPTETLCAVMTEIQLGSHLVLRPMLPLVLVAAVPLALAGVPIMELTVDNSRYFWYHHSAADTVDKVNPKELARCVAAMAVMAYIVADMPAALPR